MKNLTDQRGKHHKSASINQLKNLNNQIYSGFPVKKLQQNTPNQTNIGSFIQEASYCTMNNRVGQFSSFSLVFTKVLLASLWSKKLVSVKALGLKNWTNSFQEQSKKFPYKIQIMFLLFFQGEVTALLTLSNPACPELFFYYFSQE